MLLVCAGGRNKEGDDNVDDNDDDDNGGDDNGDHGDGGVTARLMIMAMGSQATVAP